MNSRKFISAWVLTILTTGLLILESLSDTIWGSTISIIWAAYFAANVWTKQVTK